MGICYSLLATLKKPCFRTWLAFSPPAHRRRRENANEKKKLFFVRQRRTHIKTLKRGRSNGDIAHLVERALRMREVPGSTPGVSIFLCKIEGFMAAPPISLPPYSYTHHGANPKGFTGAASNRGGPSCLRAHGRSSRPPWRQKAPSATSSRPAPCARVGRRPTGRRCPGP